MTNQELITKWFIERFERTPEQDPDYYQDWVRRFKIGSAWRNMDDESRALWLKTMNENPELTTQ